MATFEAQIEGLTGLTIESSGSSPTQAQVTQYLRAAVSDVINRIISISPEDMSKFTKTTNATGAINKRGRILSVLREHDSTAVLRPCAKIPPELRYEATDVDSLHYRSKYNPGYYELNGSIYTVPAAAGGDNDAVVTQIYYDTGIAYTDDEDNVENFSHEYGYLLTLYAACKSLQNAMAAKSSDLPSDIVPPILSERGASLPSYTTNYQYP